MRLAVRLVFAISALSSAAVLPACGSAEAQSASGAPLYLDLTHTIPTFEPLCRKPGGA